MNKSKDYVIGFAEVIPGYYELDELSRLYDFIHALPDNSLVVEIGVQYGRTASMYLNEDRHKVYLVDCWIENEGDSLPFFNNLIKNTGWEDRFTSLWERSDIAASKVPNDIDLLHIDGGHTPEVISGDCQNYLPKLKIGGIVVFHDYKRKGADPTTGSVFPGVDLAVDTYTSGPNWEDLGTVNTQAARRKLA